MRDANGLEKGIIKTLGSSANEDSFDYRSGQVLETGFYSWFGMRFANIPKNGISAGN